MVPDIIPYGYGNSGALKCSYILNESFKKDFDGVLSFLFDRVGKELVLAYFFVDNGVRFTYIPPEYIEKGTVTDVPAEPFVYFFRQGSFAN
jgi:hypothetical protein